MLLEVLDAEDIGESEEQSEEEGNLPCSELSLEVAGQINDIVARSKRVVRRVFLTAVHVAKSAYRNEKLRAYEQRPKQFNVSHDGSVCQMQPHTSPQGKKDVYIPLFFH